MKFNELIVCLRKFQYKPAYILFISYKDNMSVSHTTSPNTRPVRSELSDALWLRSDCAFSLVMDKFSECFNSSDGFEMDSLPRFKSAANTNGFFRLLVERRAVT